MALTSHYDLSLVALSVVIAIMASYVALDFVGRVTAAQGRARLAWLTGGAVAMGSGIWSMHYIGMLAFSLPVPVAYHIPTVGLSWLAAIAASLIALQVVGGPRLSWSRLLAGGLLMGAGIVTMHYTGMAAMRLQAATRYDPFLWILSAAIAAGVSFVGLSLLFHLRGEVARGWSRRKVAAAVVMGLAIPSMHYTGMAAAGFFPAETLMDGTNAVDITVLGTFSILIGTFLILGTALTLPRPGSRRPYTALPVLLVLMVMLALGIGGFALYHVEQRLLAASGEDLALAAADIADKLDRIMDERYGDIKILAQNPILRGRDQTAKTNLLNAMKTNYRYYLWLGVTDARGRIVAATDPKSVGGDRSGREWFRSARDRGGIHVRDARASEDSGENMAVAFTAAITGPRGEFLGTVTTRISLASLEDVLDETVHTMRLQRGDAARIEYQFLDRDGEVITDSLLRQHGRVNLKLLALPSALLSASARPGYIEEMHLRRHLPVMTGYASCKGYGAFTGLHWAVLVRMDRSDILTPIRGVLWKLGLAGAVVFVPMLGFLLWATRQLRKEWALAQEERDHARAAEAMVRESEQRYRHIVDYANDIIYKTGAEGRFTFCNPVAVRLLKYSEAELIGRSYLDLVHPDHRKAAERFYGRQFVRKIPHTYYEVPVLAKDGSELWIGQSVQIVLENGRMAGFQAIARDITERRRTELALFVTTRTLESVIESAPVGILTLDRDGMVTRWNSASERIFGWREDEVLGLPLPFVTPDRQEEHRALRERVLKGDVFSNLDVRRRKKDGAEIEISLSTALLRDGDGNATGVLEIATDITERKKVEQALRASEERFKGAFGHTAVGMAIVGTDGQWLKVNAALCKIVGRSEQEMLATTFQAITHPDDLEEELKYAGQLLSGAIHYYQVEKRYNHKQGHKVWALKSVSLVRDAHGTPLHFVCHVQDITEHKKAEEELLLQSAALNSAADGIIITDRAGLITWSNPAVATLTGYPTHETVGQTPRLFKSGVQAPAFYEELWATIAAGSVWQGEVVNKRKDGTLYTEEMTITPVKGARNEITHFVAIKHDIGERKQLEKQARDLSRLSMVAQLLGGIAHEMKNPLFILNGHAQMAREKLARREYDALASDLEQIDKAGRRINAITEQYLAGTRLTPPRRRPCSISALLHQAAGSLALDLKQHNIHIEMAIAPDLPEIQSDPDQLLEVFQNLMLNAIQAMAGVHPSGTLAVSAAREGPWIAAAIRDDGPGFAPEHQARLFGPLSLSGGRTGAVGLGLWIVRSTLMLLRGDIRCESEPGKGATFIVRLPANGKTFESQQITTTAERGNANEHTGH